MTNRNGTIDPKPQILAPGPVLSNDNERLECTWSSDKRADPLTG